jgi:hypothetical protein
MLESDRDDRSGRRRLPLVPWQKLRVSAPRTRCVGQREHHSATGAVPCDAARLYRAELAGDDPVRQIRATSAAHPAERPLRPRGRRLERVDAGGPEPVLAKAGIGACTTALAPLHALIEAHVLAAERLYGDDTTVPILAKGKTRHRPHLDPRLRGAGSMSAIARSAALRRRLRSITLRIGRSASARPASAADAQRQSEPAAAEAHPSVKFANYTASHKF